MLVTGNIKRAREFFARIRGVLGATLSAFRLWLLLVASLAGFLILQAYSLDQEGQMRRLFLSQRASIAARTEQALRASDLERTQQMVKLGEFFASTERLAKPLYEENSAALIRTAATLVSNVLVSLDADEIFFYSRALKPLFAVSPAPRYAELYDLALIVADTHLPGSRILCDQKMVCVQYVAVPVLYRGEDAGIVLIGSGLGYNLKSFAQGTNIQLAVERCNLGGGEDEDETAARISLPLANPDLPAGYCYTAHFDTRAELEALTQTKRHTQQSATVGVLILSGLLLVAFVIEFQLERRRLREDAAAKTRAAEALAQERAEFIEKASHSFEAERRAIARDLHDEFGQHLVAIRFDLRAITRHISDRPDIKFLVQHISGHINALHDAIRSLTDRLRPALLDTLGLQGSLESLVAESRKPLPDCDISFVAQPDPLGMPFSSCLDDSCQVALYRLAQEGLTNAVKHSGASKIEVVLCAHCASHSVDLEIRDNGRGFDPQNLGAGVGLRGMQDRATALGGTLTLDTAPGKGAHVRVSLPCVQRSFCAARRESSSLVAAPVKRA